MRGAAPVTRPTVVGSTVTPSLPGPGAMTFNSLQFAAFFAVVLVAYHQLDRRGQNWLVVVAGSVFYGAFDVRFLALLYVSIAVDFTVAKAIQASDDVDRRKHLL